MPAIAETIQYRETRYCRSCGQEKPISQFSKDPARKDNIRTQCRACSNKNARQWRLNNPERYRENYRRFRTYYEISTMGKFARLRARIKERGDQLNISLTEFEDWLSQQAEACYYCGQPLRQRNGFKENNLTFDRKNNSIGYELFNLALCCRRCNMIKGSWFSGRGNVGDSQ